ncbi:UDP-N-acetylglucosamine 1-carboxyvinyltransferase [Thermosulfuriphilus sp.]
MEEVIVIRGGERLDGQVRISGAKNAALPVLAATILAEGSFILDNVPRLEDIRTMGELLSTLGARIIFQKRSLYIDTCNLSSQEAPYHLVKRMRASVLVLGPLMARFRQAKVAMPGGCSIGARPINFHLEGLQQMGAELRVVGGFVEARAPKGLHGAEISLDFPSVTGTENLMMAATLARGRTIIHRAAREPEVVALGEFLISMGAKIEGLGTETIIIDGVEALCPIRYRIIPDRIETGTFLMAVAVTGGRLEIRGARGEHLETVLQTMARAGLDLYLEEETIFAEKNRPLKAVDITTAPYPGFPTDLQAQFMVCMTMAQGISVIRETIFENRFQHAVELMRMGADIKLVERQKAIVRGGKELSGAHVRATDLRAGASLILAGLAARGETIIHDIHHLDRGYEDIVAKLAHIGADIKRVEAQKLDLAVSK